MADRKASVALELQAGQFKVEATVVEQKVEGVDRAVEKLDRDITKIPADAAKAGAALKLLDGDVGSVGKNVNDLGNKNSGLAVLDSKIKSTRTEVRKLADEFVKTGDVDVFKKLGDSQGKLEALTKVRKELAESVEDGIKTGAKNAAGSPSMMQIGVTLGAAFAIPIVAAIGGAVTAVAGAGVAGLGIMGAVMGDPAKFQFAWQQALRGITGDFIDATKPFTNETFAAIQGLGPLIKSWHIDTIFANAAKYAAPLIHGVEGFATGIVRGVGALVEKGGPAVSALTSGMTELGQASEHALESIAGGAEGGAMALHDTIHATALLIEGFGAVVGAAENAYAFIKEHPIESAFASGGLTIPISVWTSFDKQTSVLTDHTNALQKAAEDAGHAFNLQGDDLTALSQKFNAAALSSDTLAASMVSKVFTASMNLDQAILSVHESLTKLDEAFKKHDNSIDISTAKGQAHREAVLAVVTANMQMYQAQVAAGVSAEDAAVHYQNNTAALEKQLKQAGLTTAQIDNLIGKYRDIPQRVDTDIAIHGLTDAIDNLNATIRLINGIHDKTVTVTVKQVGDNPKGQSHTGEVQAVKAMGGIRYAADGMIVAPSNPGTVLFGEPQTGGELFLPMRGIPQSRAADLLNTAGAGYGLRAVAAGGHAEQTLRVIVQYPDGRVIRDQVIDWNASRGRRDPNTYFLP